MQSMVTVFGLGYVGLTTALGFAELGYKVFGYDNNKELVDSIKQNRTKIIEPELQKKLEKHGGHNLLVTETIEESLQNSKIIFICVGTPSMDDGTVDLEMIMSCIRTIKVNLPDDDMKRFLVIKSSVPPGTCRDAIEPIMSDYTISNKLEVICNPEFMREGHCWEDFMHPSRIVIGTQSEEGKACMTSLYQKINAKKYYCSQTSAEFIKYMSNTMLATLISFSNEMAQIARIIGDVDIPLSFQILHQDNRLKNGGIRSYIYPGCGYGGYCLPKDIKALQRKSMEYDYFPELLYSVENINQNSANWIIQKIKAVAKTSSVIGVLGLSFKPESNDVRCSPSERIISLLLNEGYKHLKAYDPEAMDEFKLKNPRLLIEYEVNATELIKKSDIVIIATAWEEFKNLDYSNTYLIDGRYFI